MCARGRLPIWGVSYSVLIFSTSPYPILWLEHGPQVPCTSPWNTRPFYSGHLLARFFWPHPHGPLCSLSNDVTPTCRYMARPGQLISVWRDMGGFCELFLILSPIPESVLSMPLSVSFTDTQIHAHVYIQQTDTRHLFCARYKVSSWYPVVHNATSLEV